MSGIQQTLLGADQDFFGNKALARQTKFVQRADNSSITSRDPENFLCSQRPGKSGFSLLLPQGYETGCETGDFFYYCPLKAILVFVGMAFSSRRNVCIPKQRRPVSTVNVC